MEAIQVMILKADSNAFIRSYVQKKFKLDKTQKKLLQI